MHAIGTTAAAVLLLFAGAACETSAPALGSRDGRGVRIDTAWVALSRTAGERVPGPVFTVTLFEDGHVLFERAGVPPVAKIIPRKSAAAVFAQVEIADFWRRELRYDVHRETLGGDDVIVGQAPTDIPWDVITVHRQGRTKRIEGLFYAPHELLDLKAAIERAVNLPELLKSATRRLRPGTPQEPPAAVSEML